MAIEARHHYPEPGPHWEIDFGSIPPKERDRPSLDHVIRTELDRFVHETFGDDANKIDLTLAVRFHPGEGDMVMRCRLTLKVGPWVEIQEEREATRHRHAFTKALADLKRKLFIEYRSVMASKDPMQGSGT